MTETALYPIAEVQGLYRTIAELRQRVADLESAQTLGAADRVILRAMEGREMTGGSPPDQCAAGAAMTDATIAFFGGPRLVRTPEQIDAEKQAIIDQFATEHGPCCAGCDYWRWHNSVVGDCLRTAPVSGGDRVALLGMTGCSAQIGAVHIMTPREHWCGEFSTLHNPA